MLDQISSKNLNSFLDSANNLFTIIGVVVAGVAVKIAKDNLTAVIEQLKEMKLQREHSQEPDLFVNDTEIYIDFASESIPFNAAWNQNNSIYNSEETFPIELMNVGNGVAKYVKITVLIEEEFLNELIDYDTKNKFNLGKFEYENGWKAFKFAGESIDKTKKSSSILLYEIDKVIGVFSYINPGEIVKVSVEKKFMEIINIALLLSNIFSREGEDKILPRLKVILEYYDSFHNYYEKEISFFISSQQEKHQLESDLFTGNYKLSTLNRLPIKTKKES